MERETKSQWKYVKENEWEKKKMEKKKVKWLKVWKRRQREKSNGKEKEREEILKWKREWEREEFRNGNERNIKIGKRKKYLMKIWKR